MLVMSSVGLVMIAQYQYSLKCETLIGDCYAEQYDYDVDFLKFFIFSNKSNLLILPFCHCAKNLSRQR